MIFDEKYECMPLADLKNVQSERLAALTQYVYDRSTVYQRRFDEKGIHPSDIKTIEDIKKLPFTTKDDMRDYYPFGMFSMDVKQVREIHVSSGTTGNPTVVGYSDEDLDLWSDVMARCLCLAGGKPGDMVQNAYGYGLFTGGLGAHYGAIKAKMTVMPMSSGQTARQLKLMMDFKPRILCCTPSYSLHMLEEAVALGLDPQASTWEIGIFGAEPWTEKMRQKIQSAWNLSATDVYGLSEIIGPGVSQECTYKAGMHIFSDVFYPEVINPETGEEVAEGEYGELVVTTLTKKAIPLIRYRTRDLVNITYETCKCGRTSPRISKVKGRTDDMIVIRGINVFPSQIEHVLMSIEGTLPHYQLIVDRGASNLDSLEVLVEVDEALFSDEVRKLTAMEQNIAHAIASTLSVSAKVRLVEPQTLERSIGKAKRVIDKRQM